MDVDVYFTEDGYVDHIYVYPILKQVKPKLTTAMKSTILIGLALLFTGFPFGFLCNQRVTVPLEKD